MLKHILKCGDIKCGDDIFMFLVAVWLYVVYAQCIELNGVLLWCIKREGILMKSCFRP